MKGLSPRCNDVKGRWSGNRTRDTQALDLMLYPTELSSGGQAGIEPAADGVRHCSTSELLSRHDAPLYIPAYAAAVPRAPGRYGFRREPAPLWTFRVMRRSLASRSTASDES